MDAAGTAIADLIGPHLDYYPSGAAAAVGEKVFGLPGCASRTIRIDARTGEVEHIGPEVPGDDSYMAAVVVDDHVYAIPSCADRIMRINGTTEEIDFIGPEMQGSYKYQCACALGTRIYAIPCCAQQVMRIDCKTGDVTFVGPVLGGDEEKYEGAVAARGCIYAPPAFAKQVLRIRLDGDSERVELLGPDLGEQPYKYFCAAAQGPHAYALPNKAQRILRITLDTGECSFVGPDFGGAEAQYMSPAVVGGRIYGVPCKVSTEKNILCIEGGSGAVTFVGPESEEEGAFFASAVVGRRVYALPQGAPHVLSIDGGGGVGLQALASAESSYGCAAVCRGRIFAFPCEPGQILRLTPGFFRRSADRWGSGILDPAAGRHNYYPEDFLPQCGAGECMDSIVFAQQPEVVQLARDAAALAPAADRGEFMAIYAYTLESGLYAEVTAAMRLKDQQRLQQWREYIYHLERALLRQPFFEGTVFRGSGTLIDEGLYKVGTKVAWQGLSSATQRAEVLVRHRLVKVLNDDELSGTIFVISSRSARCVDHISDLHGDHEVVFGPNSLFKVQATVSDLHEKRAVLPELSAYNLAKLRVFRMDEL